MIRAPALTLALAAGLLAAPLLAQSAPPATVTVTAEAKVARAPDIVTLGAGVVTSASQASAAMTDNARRMSAVIAALKRAGVAERDMQTSAINLQPQYRYEQNQPPQLTGYQATNRVDVRLRKMTGVGPAVDALVAAGANNIDGPSFAIDKPEPALDEARAEAVRRARARADLYARAAGLAIRRVISISEGAAQQPPRPMPMMRMMAAESAPATPVAAGEVELTASVTIVYELQ